MKPLHALLATLLLATAADAQQFTSSSNEGGSFSIGPRYSNYSTDVDLGGATLETGRQHAFGLVGGYRSGAFVLDFLLDHDPENGIGIDDFLPFDLENYSRDRVEGTVGWSVLPMLDLQAGVRMDQITLGGLGFDSGFFDSNDLEFQALTAGVNFHTPADRQVGFYALARFYAGTAKFEDDARGDDDATGWRAEAGVAIPIGESAWHIVPGIEKEHLELQEDFLDIDTNRFFVNFVFSTGRR